MFKNFLTITIGCTVFLFTLGFFAKYVRESIEQHEQQVESYNQSLRPVTSTRAPIDLMEAQRRVLGYKDVPIVPWRAEDPKPPRAHMPKQHQDNDIECLDDECRWTKIVGD